MNGMKFILQNKQLQRALIGHSTNGILQARGLLAYDWSGHRRGHVALQRRLVLVHQVLNPHVVAHPVKFLQLKLLKVKGLAGSIDLLVLFVNVPFLLVMLELYEVEAPGSFLSLQSLQFVFCLESSFTWVLLLLQVSGQLLFFFVEVAPHLVWVLSESLESLLGR